MGRKFEHKSKIYAWLNTLSEEDQLNVKWDIALLYKDTFTPEIAGRKVLNILTGKLFKPKKNIELRILILDICKKYDNSVEQDTIFE